VVQHHLSLTPAERKLRAQIAAHESWANTTNRTARTAKGRQAFEDKFLAEADGDPQRAESLRKAYYARLALSSARARRRRSGIRSGTVLAGLAELDGGGDHAA
jgi:hypothetical protein